MRALTEYFSLADRDFYEHPVHWRPGEPDFPLALAADPPGWSRADRDGWVSLFPSGRELPWQGWKIHVSTLAEAAGECLTTVSAILLRRSVAFKFLRRPGLVRATNLKYAPRSASGKFITVYPRDDDEFTATLAELDAALTGRPGPFVLSDLRFRSGPLYVRYGGFRSRWCRRSDGERCLAIAGPDGRLVPDERTPGFAVPAWVRAPEILRSSLAERAGGDRLPYLIESALHFSNGGGVYLGRTPDDGPAPAEPVVLKEARPHAGLAGDGTDAVVRLTREAAALRTLAGVPGLPRLIDEHQVWEHRFLAVQKMPGSTLQQWVARWYPLIGAEPGPAARADYARRAGAVLDQVEQVVRAVHARGYIVGDIHPANIMVDEQDRVALIDLEAARPVADANRQTNGHAGFVSARATGFEIDRHALDVLSLWVHLPMTELLGLAPERRTRLTAIARAEFPTATRLRSGPPGAERGRPGASAAPVDATLADSMARAVTASATPGRSDRLFPGDLSQFEPGQGSAFGHGAAGVIWALGAARRPVPESWLDWLSVHADPPGLPPGFLDGAAGVAYVLAGHGRNAAAATALGRSVAAAAETTDVSLQSGLAGIGWALLHTEIGEPADRLARAAELADRLIGMIDDGAAHGVDVPSGPAGRATDAGTLGGLLLGWSGVALFLLRLFERTGRADLLTAAGRAVRRDLRLCVTAGNGSRQVDGGFRTWPYLEVGSAGIALVIDELLGARDDPELRAALPGLAAALTSPFVVDAHLRRGRAGLLAAAARLARTRPELGTAAVADAHRRRLDWHRVDWRGECAFAGDGGHRRSMDFLTGTAGVLAAVAAALDPTCPFLPFLPAAAQAAAADPGSPRRPGRARASGSRPAAEIPGGGSHVDPGIAGSADHRRGVGVPGKHDLELLLR